MLPSTTYIGCDVSPVMVSLAARRLEAYRERGRVLYSDGTAHFPITSHSVDHVVCNYVLDLLSDGDILTVLAEA